MGFSKAASIAADSAEQSRAPRAGEHDGEASPDTQTQAAPGRTGLSNAGHVPVAVRGEENDAYPVLVALNCRWRVIVCKNSIQWILQTRRGGPDSWRGRSFCRTREALVRCARQHAGEIAADAMVILLRLPGRIGGAP